MHAARFPGSRPRALVVLVSALLAWASVAAVASAVADKTFSASLAPSALVAGASYGVGRDPIILAIKNESTQAQLGSANVTLPEGLVLTGAQPVSPAGGTAEPVGQVIEMRNLNLQPGSSAVVNVSARVECSANHQLGYTWGLTVKQANDFNGTPGNNLAPLAALTNTITGQCGLIFSNQPKSSEKLPVVITSKIYDPAGPAVTVSVLDAQGVQPVSWWNGTINLTEGNDPTPGGLAKLTGGLLDAGLSGPAVNGSVEFKPSIDISATGYTVVANASPGNSASGGTSTGLASLPFNIVDDATICKTTADGCSATAGEGQKTKAQVDASPNGAAGDLVILSINDPTVSIDCAGYIETSDVVVFNVTDSGGVNPSARSKTTTLTLRAADVTKSASKYQVCYEGTTGAQLLPTCATKNPAPPCVVSKALDKSKNLVIVVSSPAGDPKLNF